MRQAMKKSDCQKDINTDGNAMTFTVIYEGVKSRVNSAGKTGFFVPANVILPLKKSNSGYWHKIKKRLVLYHILLYATDDVHR